MSIEEAIRHLQEARKYPVAYTEEEQKAYEMAFAALRAQKATLDRSRWEGCKYCKGRIAPDYQIKPCGNGDLDARAVFCNGDDGPGIVLLINRNEASGYFDILFCPMCGKPLTEDAWAELERRVK